ncbi:MAG: SIMPL domain-containing protein [Myxococcota bacterium]|nr:SIMPL domain-containing protein [Myxococcota bacterium]
MSVIGTATVHAVPDTVVWKLTTVSTHPNLVSAKRDSDIQVKSILKAAVSLGVSTNDIQTGFLSVEREYEHGKFTSRRTFKNFRVAREVTLRERDITQFDQFLTRLVESSDMEIHCTLESSELTSLQEKTRLEAMQAARAKAAAMAGALESQLGNILTIREEGQRGGFQTPATNTVSWKQYDGRMTVLPANSSFAPGTIEVTVSVATVFELR